jgi:DNA-3-methyladenine glycosylase I
MTNQILTRCAWVTENPIDQIYHDTEWGVPLYDDIQLFELLILEGLQAGLSWITILKKRENYRKVFDNFNPFLIADYTDTKIESLLKNPQIIRNRLKILATIQNAKAYLQLIKYEKSFSDYIWEFVSHTPIINTWDKSEQVPNQSKISSIMAKDLKARGFKFVGNTICYAFMQASGMVNDHTTNCFKRMG